MYVVLRVAFLSFPGADMISTSIFNPHVWSERIWEVLKSYAPQRARDLSRLLGLAIANSLHVINTDKSAELSRSTITLRNNAFQALATPQGHDVIQNCVATVAKTMEAIGTPEAKAVMLQASSTLKSYIHMLATPEGQQVMDDLGSWVSNCADVASSPETTIFLFEVATNLCQVFIDPNDTRSPAERIDALETAMLNKLGVSGPLHPPEETLPDLSDSDDLFSEAFEGTPTDTPNEPVPEWHPQVTHPTLRHRNQRQRLHQSLRTSRRLGLRTRAVLQQMHHQRTTSQVTIRPLPSAIDRIVCRAMSVVLVVFLALFLLMILVALSRQIL
ncbi:hypothetical protein LEN26_006720 [Aphanomyces euteiches]|nr:hypothetical protein LEN26_006720 [Aphanomyces euteiches]